MRWSQEGRVRERLEDTMFLILKMESGALSQQMQGFLECGQAKGKGSPLEASEVTQLC